MPGKDEDDLVRGLQAAADGYAKGEVEVMLAGSPHLYRLPECSSAGVISHSPDKVELLLDTAAGHRFLMAMNAETAGSLRNLLDFALGGR